MNAVMKQQPQEVPVLEGATLLAVISRAAADPGTDVEKMERLMALYERIEARRAETEFNSAMTATQSEMRPVSADATNPQTRSKYPTYHKLDSVLRPIYTKHGFSLSFDEADSPKPEHVRVVCYVAHEAGHTRTYHRDMPADGKGAKGGDVMTKTHAAGAASSYGARYLLKGIFNVAVGEDDDDGNGGAGSDSQVIAEWVAAIDGCTTIEELQARGKELAASAASAKDRKAIKPAYEARMKALKGAK